MTIRKDDYLSFVKALSQVFTIGILFLFIAHKQVASTKSEKKLNKAVDYKKVYGKIASSGISMESFCTGYNGYTRICDSLNKTYRYLCIADFKKPSSKKRLYIIDMKDTSLLHHDYVAHGKNSGMLTAESFSNRPQSNQSSLGFYLISESYFGKHGLSLRLDGLDHGFNHKARTRAVVIHAADYVEKDFLVKYGRLGRSQGCPALPFDGFKKVAPLIKNKSILFIYFPHEKYLNKSVWLKEMPSESLVVAE